MELVSAGKCDCLSLSPRWCCPSWLDSSFDSGVVSLSIRSVTSASLVVQKFVVVSSPNFLSSNSSFSSTIFLTFLVSVDTVQNLPEAQKEALITEVSEILIAAGAVASTLSMEGGIAAEVAKHAMNPAVRDQVWNAMVTTSLQ